MKTVSQKNLDKLIKEKGWNLTPDSKKSIRDRDKAVMRSKQVEAITNLSKNVDGVREAVKAIRNDNGKDYTETINKLTESIDSIASKIPVIESWKEIDFIVERDGAGTISKVRAKKV